MKRITDNIYIGNSDDVLSEEVLLFDGITSVVIVAKDFEAVAIPDYEKVLINHQGIIAGPGNHVKDFDKTVKTIQELVSKGHKVLIACHSGRDRSPVVATAVISQQQNISFDDAWTTVVEQLEDSIHPVDFATDEAAHGLISLTRKWCRISKDGENL